MAHSTLCFVIPSLETGGTERQLEYLVSGLKDSYNLHVFCFFPGGQIRHRLQNNPVLTVHTIKREGGLDFTVPFRLAERFQELKPRAVQTFLPLANVFGGLAAYAAGVPRIFTGLRMSGQQGSHKTPSMYRKLDRFVGNYLVTGVVCNSFRGKQDAETRGYKSDKLHVIPNGIDPNRVLTLSEERPEIAMQGENPRIGMFSRIAPMKDVRTYLDSLETVLQSFPEGIGYIAGAGSSDAQKSLVQEISSRGLEKQVRYLGTLNNPYPVMKRMDIVVSTSKYGEGMSNSLMEAMCLGVPVVATRVGDAEQLLDGGKAGVLVPPESPGVIARNLIELIQDPNRREQLARRAESHIQKYSIENMVNLYVQLYSDASPASSRTSR